MDRTRRDEERRAAWYDAHSSHYERRHPGLPGDVGFYAALAYGRRVLEIGCGTGRVTRGLVRGAALVVALDRSEAMLHVARSALTEFSAGRLILADAPVLPFGPSFDLVLLTYRTVQHLSPSRRQQLWRGTLAVLRPDGAIAFDTWLGPATGRGSPAEVSLEPLTIQQTEAELVAAGVSVVDGSPFPPGAGDDSLSRVWIAAGQSGAPAVEKFHELLDT